MRLAERSVVSARVAKLASEMSEFNRQQREIGVRAGDIDETVYRGGRQNVEH